jgi:hypothetical protein
VVDVPKEIEGAPEIWIAGANRSSKSEYAAKKIMKVLHETPRARTWSFADTGPISIARQQPIFWKYMPAEIKRLAADTGKARQGVTLNVSYKQKTGFAEQSFVLPNGSQHWLKNYEQDLQNVEGDQLDAIWLDELRNIELLRTLRGRTIDRGGLIIVTFTAIDDNYSPICNEYERGARTVLEVDAELLPIKRPKILAGGNSLVHVPVTGVTKKEPEEPGSPPAKKSADGGLGKQDRGRPSSTGPADAEDGFEIVGHEKVPRVKIAGPGNDGNLRANIVFFHITDNPYFGFEGAMSRRRDGRVPLFGKERFYRAYRNATKAKILSRVYGILQAGSSAQFPKFSDAVHVIEPERIPRNGSNYHIVDPCDGRTWAMLWIRIDPSGRWYVYREWPSTGGSWAYIPGYGDIGEWTLPGKPADGVRGPAQTGHGFGLDAYLSEIRRLEGWAEEEDEEDEEIPLMPLRPFRRLPGRPLPEPEESPAPAERIEERWMDSRYGARPTNTREGQTTLLEQCAELGLEFKAASGKEISEGTVLINNMLDYDQEIPLGQFSAKLARLNGPRLYVSSQCRNTIYSLREWTGKDGNKGASKDWIDLLRYATLAELDFVGEGAYTWSKG